MVKTSILREKTDVMIRSNQTSKSKGKIVNVELDPIWGPQYRVRVEDIDAGEMFYWMRDDEIAPFASGNRKHQ